MSDANEIYTKKTYKNLYSTGLRLGFASGKMQLLGFALGKNAKKLASPSAKDTNMLVSPTQKSGVGAIAQRQPPTPEFCVAVEYRLKG